MTYCDKSVLAPYCGNNNCKECYSMKTIEDLEKNSSPLSVSEKIITGKGKISDMIEDTFPNLIY